MSEQQTCLLCEGKELEVNGSEVMCRTCGYGHGDNATKEGLEIHLQNIAKVILTLKKVEPDLTANQITDRVCKILHKVEKHPTRKDGYCEYCEEII